MMSNGKRFTVHLIKWLTPLAIILLYINIDTTAEEVRWISCALVFAGINVCSFLWIGSHP